MHLTHTGIPISADMRHKWSQNQSIINLIHHSEFTNWKDYLGINVLWSLFSKGTIKDCSLKDKERQRRVGAFWGITRCSSMGNHFWRTVVRIQSGSDRSVRTWCLTERAQHSLVEKQNEQSHEDIKASNFTAIWFPAPSRAVKLMQVLSGYLHRLHVS